MAHRYTETPQNDTATQYANLENIKRQSAAAVTVAREERTKIHTEDQKQSIQTEQIQKEAAPSNAHSEVASSLLFAGADLKGIDDVMSFISERCEAPSGAERDALGGFIGDNVQTLDDLINGFSTGSSFSINDRANLACNALTGKSEAMDDNYMPSAKGWRGTDMQMTFTSELANKMNYEKSIQMQQEYEARISGQVYARGLTPGGMGGAQMRHLALNHLAPPPPKSKPTEEDATNWGAGTVTG